MKPSKSTYFVFMTMDATAPLQGETPHGGEITDYETLDEAQSRAKAEQAKWDLSEKNKWDRLLVCERTNECGQFTVIDRYWKGKKGK